MKAWNWQATQELPERRTKEYLCAFGTCGYVAKCIWANFSQWLAFTIANSFCSYLDKVLQVSAI